MQCACTPRFNPLGIENFNACTQVASSPPLLAGVAALAVGLPAAGWIRNRLGGYNGQLQPAAALEMLQSENAILLDMRWLNMMP